MKIVNTLESEKSEKVNKIETKEQSRQKGPLESGQVEPGKFDSPEEWRLDNIYEEEREKKQAEIALTKDIVELTKKLLETQQQREEAAGYANEAIDNFKKGGGNLSDFKFDKNRFCQEYDELNQRTTELKKQLETKTKKLLNT